VYNKGISVYEYVTLCIIRVLVSISILDLVYHKGISVCEYWYLTLCIIRVLVSVNTGTWPFVTKGY
jgi:hypothetical protein